MKRRIRIGAASLMVAAGLVGAVAAPVSASPPTFDYVATCLVPNNPPMTDGPFFGISHKLVHLLKQNDTAFCNDNGGTLTITITRN